jgi:hypothetical protein
MAKIDKTQYTKEQFQKIRDRRKLEKQRALIEKNEIEPTSLKTDRNLKLFKTAFVLGNGTSRQSIDIPSLEPHGIIYGCNALYREYSPDFLVAVDVKMILEIASTGYQNTNQVWTNPNKAYRSIKNLNLFQPSKGWSSGPTALWLSARHEYNRIFILGFDYKGIGENNRLVNNLYAGTLNYKKVSDGATYYGNWLKQTTNILKENPKVMFIRVITPDNFVPPELNKFNNIQHIFIEDFKKMFNIS